MSAVRQRLPSLVIIAALIGGPALAQDLNEGKSGSQLYAANCAGCHHNPHGLAKDRYGWTLSSFLQEHYTNSSASAQALTAYLHSVDAPRAKSKGREPAMSGEEPPPRPPAPVPRR